MAGVLSCESVAQNRWNSWNVVLRNKPNELRITTCQNSLERADGTDRKDWRMSKDKRLARMPLCAMYQRTDKRGVTYLSGRFGAMKLLIFETNEESRGSKIWQAIVTESDELTPGQLEVLEHANGEHQ